MGRRKIIFLDVDGTLVDYKGRLPESAAAAVRLARQQGHKSISAPEEAGRRYTLRSGTSAWTG